MSKVSAPEYDLILPHPFTGDIPEGWTSRLLAQGHPDGAAGQGSPQPPAVLMSVNPDSAASSRPGTVLSPKTTVTPVSLAVSTQQL